MPTQGGEPAERQREARVFRRLRRSLVSADSYGLVLLMIVVTYVLAVSVTQRWGASVLLFAQVGTVWVALRTSSARPGLRLAGGVLFVLAVLGSVMNLIVERSELFSSIFVAGSLLYFVAPFSIIRHIGFRREVDQETLIGALSAYLFFGMAFAFAYSALATIQSGPFFGASGDGSVSSTLFFSFVTLTTTGYGNLVPASNPGQSLAVLEALMGQLFLVTAVAKVVNAWRPRAWRGADHDRPGPD